MITFVMSFLLICIMERFVPFMTTFPKIHYFI